MNVVELNLIDMLNGIGGETGLALSMIATLIVIIRVYLAGS